jgi:hypothetical protein
MLLGTGSRGISLGYCKKVKVRERAVYPIKAGEVD